MTTKGAPKKRTPVVKTKKRPPVAKRKGAKTTALDAVTAEIKSLIGGASEFQEACDLITSIAFNGVPGEPDFDSLPELLETLREAIAERRYHYEILQRPHVKAFLQRFYKARQAAHKTKRKDGPTQVVDPDGALDQDEQWAVHNHLNSVQGDPDWN